MKSNNGYFEIVSLDELMENEYKAAEEEDLENGTYVPVGYWTEE